MSYNWKEVEFELQRRQDALLIAQKIKVDLIDIIRRLQMECVNRDSSVCDSDVVHESRALLHKLTMNKD